MKSGIIPALKIKTSGFIPGSTVVFCSRKLYHLSQIQSVKWRNMQKCWETLSHKSTKGAIILTAKYRVVLTDSQFIYFMWFIWCIYHISSIMYHFDFYSCIHNLVSICNIVREQSSGCGLLMNDYKYHLMGSSCL